MFDIFHTIFKYREKESPDRLGLYPERVHVNAMPERRYLWTSRILVVISCLSISFNILLSSTIYLLLPQRSASPRLLQVNKYFSVLEHTEPQETGVSVVDLIAEQYIEEYINLRHVITTDYDELLSRWSEGSALYWLSSRQVFQNFSSNDVDKNLMDFRANPLTRLVEVEWVKPLTQGLWQAQFVTMDYYPDEQTPVVNIWRAYVRIVFTNINFPSREAMAYNPFGFLVINYSLAYVGTPDQPLNYLATAKEVREQRYRSFGN